MDKYILVFLNITYQMELENIFGIMETIIMDNLQMEKGMEKE